MTRSGSHRGRSSHPRSPEAPPRRPDHPTFDPGEARWALVEQARRWLHGVWSRVRRRQRPGPGGS